MDLCGLEVITTVVQRHTVNTHDLVLLHWTQLGPVAQENQPHVERNVVSLFQRLH